MPRIESSERSSSSITSFGNTYGPRPGLRLADSQGTGTISIRVVAGFPAKLAELIDRHQDRVLWRLIIGQPKLGGIVEGLNFLLPDWPEFEEWLNLPSVAKGSEPALVRTRDVAAALQGLAVTKKVLDELKEIHEDVLGVYRFAKRGLRSKSIGWQTRLSPEHSECASKTWPS